MVGDDQELALDGLQGFDNLADAGIDRFNGLDSGFKDARMADHIGIGEIEHDHVIFIGLNLFDDFFRHDRRVHFRLQIVSRNFRRRHEDTVFTGIGFFFTAIKEIRDVSVFFRFGNAQLGLAGLGQDFAQCVGDPFFIIDDVYRKVVFVTGHGRKVRVQFLRTREAVEIGDDESGRQLTGPVGAEVEEDDAVPILDGMFMDDCRDDEFVGNVSCIGMFQAGLGIRFLRSFAEGDGIIGFFDAFPALVAVHGIVAAADGGDFTDAEFCALVFQFLEVFAGTAGQYVAAVEEGVDVDFLQAIALRHFQKTIEMLFTAVDAARRYQAQQVESRVFFLDVFHGTDESRLLEESSVFDILGDLGQRLVHNTSRTDIKMAHFRVANLAVRQTDVFARCAEIRMRIFFPKFRQDLEVCLGYGVIFFDMAAAKTIHDDQHYRFLFRHYSF